MFLAPKRDKDAMYETLKALLCPVRVDAGIGGESKDSILDQGLL